MKTRVIVDIDGTISKVGERLKYLQQDPKDWEAFYADCFDDEPIPEIITLVQDLFENLNDIIFCTGRRESCRAKTKHWIEKNLGYKIATGCLLLMRENNDHRHDTEVKPGLIKNAGIELGSIAYVLEDRTSMVKKWRELGLICLQVAEGDF
jgi:uncharacterized HAD superfamily protein